MDSIIINKESMRTIALLFLVALVCAEPVKVTELDSETDLKDTEALVAQVQGDNKNLYLIVFEKDDEEDHVTDLKTALEGASTDDVLKQYDIFQDSFDGSWEIKIGQVDGREQRESLALVGADDKNFKMTFPLLMIVREGKGFLASMTEYTKDAKLAGALQAKILKVTGAKKQKPEEAAADEGGDEPAERR